MPSRYPTRWRREGAASTGLTPTEGRGRCVHVFVISGWWDTQSRHSHSRGLHQTQAHGFLLTSNLWKVGGFNQELISSQIFIECLLHVQSNVA